MKNVGKRRGVKGWATLVVAAGAGFASVLGAGWATPALADEAEMMGTIAGAAEVCGAGQKLDDYEVIAGNILLNKTYTKDAQRSAIFNYALGKTKGRKKQELLPVMSCDDFLAYFNNMDIFKATVYADGTVKLTDGTVLKSTKGAADPSAARGAGASGAGGVASAAAGAGAQYSKGNSSRGAMIKRPE